MQVTIQSIIPDYFTPASSEVWSKNFEFQPNSKYLVKAVSGSGKSSLFNFIYGLNNRFSGSILFNDTSITSFSESEWTTIRTQKIAIVFQGLKLFPELTALENIQLKNILTNHKTEAEILDMMSCKAAIKAGDHLTQQELKDLLRKRKEIERGSNCPHGRPTTMVLSIEELEQHFGRR